MTLPRHPWWSTRIFAIAMMLAAAVPLLWPVTPPLIDLPGHMGRWAVQTAPTGSPLHQWFSFEWAVIGNLGLDLLVVPMTWLFGLEQGVKLLVIAIPPLTVAGMLLVAREAHGDVPSTAALALPLAYGYPFQFGFVNFALSMAMALLGLAMWLRLGRTRRVRLRAAVFVPYGIALWFTHSFGWGVLGLTAFAAELVFAHRRGSGWLRSAWQAGWAMLPLLPPAALMLIWRSGHVGGTTGDWFNWKAKAYYVESVLRNDGTDFDWGSGIILLLVAGVGLMGLGFRRNWLLTIAALLLVTTFVLLPRIALGSAYADMRLAPYMLAVMLLAIRPASRNHALNSAIAAVAIGFFLVRMAVQTETFVRVDRGFQAQLEALDHVPRGSRIFALVDLPCLSTPYPIRLDHAEAMAMVRRESFSNGQWSMAGAQLLRVHFPGAPGFSGDPSQILRPERCRPKALNVYPEVLGKFPREAFDYVWLINFAPDLRPNNDSGLVAVWQGPRGALYRIRKTPTAG